ncbi:hypothetical protein MIND_00830500 [Mycena indigotica]|uniref:Aquaporin n=1 Tax=Mycena indigotica TaxID=2126181 RepID=A0A8H6VYH5_9AGAR|nr:uncharacterized protein MIND_00830500 [Mycena indigotica]KAF7298829.1 hypothetical protein MIND_00830500 [Mycena indigotica]
MSMSKAPDAISAHGSSTKEDHIEHLESYTGDGVVTIHPNWWSKYRLILREYMAEFLGVCILVIFGTGVDCQVVLATSTAVASSGRGEYLSINVGWGVGTAMGVWVSGGYSGGHINPAVTLALATWRGFPWKKVPGYIFAQTMGGLVGAALVYANYYHGPIQSAFEGGDDIRTLSTASLFSTYALPYMTNVSCFFSEFLATAVLLVMVLAVGDSNNLPPPSGLAPLFLFVLILGIGASLGMETGYAINPARDLGPRLFTSMAGYGRAVYTYRNHYWLWCPVLAPIFGAQFGCAFYDIFLYSGDESPVNKPNATARAHHEHAAHAMRRNIPAGHEQMALNLNYAAHTYLALTLPPSSSYLQTPSTLAQIHPAAAYVGQVGAMADVQLVSIPKAQWESSEAARTEIMEAFTAVGRVDVQEPKQRAKRDEL